MKDKVKFLNIEDILTLIILNLKELKITKNQDSKEFLDNEIFPSLKLLISQGLLKSKQIISIMKFLINYESDYMDNEFLPFFFKILNDKKMFEKAEDVVLAMNFVEFYENKISKLNLQASASETKLFLSLNYFQKETSERKIEGPINT